MTLSRFIARLFGLAGLLFILVVLLSGGAFLERVSALVRDPGFVYQSGLFNLLIGLAIVIGHNVWDRSWRVVITVIGYLAVLKGIVFLGWPNVLTEIWTDDFVSEVMPVQLVFSTVFYGWLSWLGFRTEKGTAEASGVAQQLADTE